MKPTPVRKLKEYQGPRNHGKIVSQIYKDAQDQGIDISPIYIRTVVYLFFSLFGMCRFFKNIETFEIRDIGKWALNSKGKREQKKKRKKEKLYKKRRLAEHMKFIADRGRLNNAKRKVYLAHEKVVSQFNEQNNILAAKGATPWEWAYYCRQKNKNMFINWGTETGKRRRFDPFKYISLI